MRFCGLLVGAGKGEGVQVVQGFLFWGGGRQMVSRRGLGGRTYFEIDLRGGAAALGDEDGRLVVRVW